ncbi:MAG TPA: tetratricopeptide repeat protein [Candidatus Omnitrophota bacterium]|nr:tetratricopeptide repeat protein [Candidatus Omnitrophota bacterium]
MISAGDIKKIRNIGIVVVVIIFVFLGITIKLAIDKKNFQAEIARSKEVLNKLEKNLLETQKEKESLKKEQEKLQADAISYIGTNAAMEEERNRLKELLKESQEKIKLKEKELEVLTERAGAIEEELAKQKNVLNNDYQKKLKETVQENKNLRDQLNKEKALYHYNLAVALTRANLIDSAIDEYETSIKIDANNPEAYYNLAVLFDRMGYSPRKTVRYYKRYLDLSPDAEDREEVLIAISKLEGRL